MHFLDFWVLIYLTSMPYDWRQSAGHIPPPPTVPHFRLNCVRLVPLRDVVQSRSPFDVLRLHPSHHCCEHGSGSAAVPTSSAGFVDGCGRSGMFRYSLLYTQ